MSTIVTISDITPRGVIIGILPVLEALTPFGKALFWRIRWLGATLRDESSIDFDKLMTDIQRDPRGLSVSWMQLIEIAPHFQQFEQGSLSGYQHENDATPDPPFAGLIARHSWMCIQLIDVSTWEIYCRDNSIASHIQSRFSKVEVYEL